MPKKPIDGQKNFTSSLLALVIPIAFQNLISAAVSSADVVMLGSAGQTALSAVSLASQVTFVLNLFYFGLSTGVVILTSQYWGKGDINVIEKVLGLAIKLSGCISTVFFIATLVIPRLLMRIFTPDAELIDMGIWYLRVIGFSYLLMSISQMYLAAVKSIEHARLSAIISSACLMLNIGFNAIAVYVLFPDRPELAVAGVAGATVLARAIELAWCLIYSRSRAGSTVPANQIAYNDVTRQVSPLTKTANPSAKIANDDSDECTVSTNKFSHSKANIRTLTPSENRNSTSEATDSKADKYDHSHMKATRIHLRIHLSYIFHTESWLVRDFIKYTAPVQANYIVWGGALTATSAIMGHVSSDMVAANSIASVVRNLAIVLCNGVAGGGGILLGKHLGEKNIPQARKDGWYLCLWSLIFGAIAGLTVLLSRPIAMNLVSLNEAAYKYLDGMLYICAYYCIGKSFNATAVSGIFCAGGDSRFGLLCDTIAMWGVIIPLGCLCAFLWELPPIALYAVLCLDEFIKMPAVIIHYRKYKWLNNITREVS